MTIVMRRDASTQIVALCMLVVLLIGIPAGIAVAQGEPMDFQSGLSQAGQAAGGASGDVSSFILSIANGLAIFAAVVALAYIVLGGFRYITSVGDERAVESAKKMVSFALIGLIFVIIAAVIVNFIVTSISS